MRKLFAILLAALLILSLCTVAFAVDVAPAPTDAKTVTVTKSYKLIGAGTSPEETFTLAQVSSSVKDSEATSAPDLGTITGAAFDAGDAAAAGTEKDITIALPSYERVGVYEYTLKEVAGTTAGVTYFGNDIKLVVTVINDDTIGKLRVAAVHTEATGENKSDKFENTYSAGTLKISKTVTGNLGDKDKFFEFTVTLTGVEGKTYAENFAVTGGSYTDNPATIALGTATKFYLKDGETISIANLPYGVTYSVVENTYSDYTTDKTGDNGTINAAEQTAAFTNHKQGDVDTGIFLDSLPYVLILAVVVLAGVLMVIKRRRAER